MVEWPGADLKVGTTYGEADLKVGTTLGEADLKVGTTYSHGAGAFAPGRWTTARRA